MKKTEIRKRKVFKHLVEEFISTNEPIPSKLISKKYIESASSATIRLDLTKLEKENLIFQQHTSGGRIPTIKGYRRYIQMIKPELENTSYANTDSLRKLLINYYKDIPLALHYIMQLLAKETDQLSFVAEPEISHGSLEKIDVFKISKGKLLFVISLDSGMDKTVILKCDYNITSQQLKALVRYVNEEFVGQRIFDIQSRFINETSESISDENKLLKSFLDELENALSEISSFFVHFDGNISFLEQPEFDDKSSILTFLGFIQRQDHLIKIMRENDHGDKFNILMGEDLGQPQLINYSLIYAKYELFGVPGYLGALGPIRMNYKKNIPIISNIAEIITETTKKGMVVPKNG